MNEEPTTAAIQRYLDALQGRSGGIGLPDRRSGLRRRVGVDPGNHGIENGLLGLVDAGHGVVNGVGGIHLGLLRAGFQQARYCCRAEHSGPFPSAFRAGANIRPSFPPSLPAS